jgi:hypothetical protein
VWAGEVGEAGGGVADAGAAPDKLVDSVETGGARQGIAAAPRAALASSPAELSVDFGRVASRDKASAVAAAEAPRSSFVGADPASRERRSSRSRRRCDRPAWRRARKLTTASGMANFRAATPSNKKAAAATSRNAESGLYANRVVARSRKTPARESRTLPPVIDATRVSSARSVPVGRISWPAFNTAPAEPTISFEISSTAVARYLPGRASGIVAAYAPAPTASSDIFRVKPSGPPTAIASRRKVCARPSSPTTVARTWSSPPTASASRRTRGSSALRATSRAICPNRREAAANPVHFSPHRSLKSEVNAAERPTPTLHEARMGSFSGPIRCTAARPLGTVTT